MGEKPSSAVEARAQGCFEARSSILRTGSMSGRYHIENVTYWDGRVVPHMVSDEKCRDCCLWESGDKYHPEGYCKQWVPIGEGIIPCDGDGEAGITCFQQPSRVLQWERYLDE
jgi:hypothetical protein